MSNGNGHHWSKFFWRDWSADKALHPCTLAAKGFWIELLCIMHEGAPVGHLTLGGKPATMKQLAANANCTEKEAARYLAELEEAGVFSRTDDGTIFCRRMVKDAATSDVGREHAAKRWKGSHPNGSPNAPPNGGPTGKPNGHAIGDPIGTPYAKKLEAESELEAEEDSKKDLKLLVVEEPSAREANLAPETPGTAPGTDLVTAMARRMFSNYPPRAPLLTVNQQRDAVAPKPKLRDVSLSREQLNSLRKTA